MTLEAPVRAALRQVLETAAPLTRGAAIAALAPPVQSVFLVRSGSAAMLREALQPLRAIAPLPRLCVLGREDDREAVAQAWSGASEVFAVSGDRDYSWQDVRQDPAIAEAIRGCTHHGFLARGAAAAGYENLFEIFAACGVRSCFAATVGGGLVSFDLDSDQVRRASADLCEAIVTWTHALTGAGTR